MNILLLGELSGVHQELSGALSRLGHDVTVAHSRLAAPGFDSDVPFFRPPPGPETRWTAARDILSQWRHMPRLAGFDVVQMITQKFFHWKIQRRMMELLSSRNSRLVIVNATCSASYFDEAKTFAYRPCGDCQQFDLKREGCIYDRPDERAVEDLVFGMADRIVATHYDYSMKSAPDAIARKVVPIPLPIDTTRHRPVERTPGSRVRIWYGETRFGFKGGRFIGEALDRLATSDLAGQVDIVRTQRQPPAEYFRSLDTADIVIDQSSSQNAGMNGLYAMARGRTVLTGAEPDALAYMGIPPDDCPAVNIRPDAGHIYQTLRGLVLRRDELPSIGRRSAEFVAKYHSADVVARQYVRLYQSLFVPAD